MGDEWKKVTDFEGSIYRKQQSNGGDNSGFLVAVSIVLIVVLVIGILYAVGVVVYYATSPWWYPLKNIVALADAIERRSSTSAAVFTTVAGMVAGFICAFTITPFFKRKWLELVVALSLGLWATLGAVWVLVGLFEISH